MKTFFTLQELYSGNNILHSMKFSMSCSCFLIFISRSWFKILLNRIQEFLDNVRPFLNKNSGINKETISKSLLPFHSALNNLHKRCKSTAIQYWNWPSTHFCTQTVSDQLFYRKGWSGGRRRWRRWTRPNWAKKVCLMD